MKISNPQAELVCEETDVYLDLLPLKAADVLELGCGKAEKTLNIAKQVGSILALEIDEIQHAENLASQVPANVRFESAGAQAIPAANLSFDVVLMFKSLHHVPVDQMDKAMAEIHRVLKNKGLIYISEPVFAGDFNEILRIFHDEQAVRAAAFAATERAVLCGQFELVSEIFFATPLHFDSFAQFESKVINVTHSHHQVPTDLYQQVREKFMCHMTPLGAAFEMPIRVDLLRKLG